MIHVCVAIVLYGESPYAIEVLTALQMQELDDGTNLSLVIVDNGVPETVKGELLETFGGKILMLRNLENLGFSAAVNQALAEALNYKADYLLLLNPDLMLESLAVRELVRAAKRYPDAAMITPKLLRANSDLSPTSPPIIDACGMIMNDSLRHLDRGSGEIDTLQYDKEEEVFGGTGACLLVNLKNIEELLLSRTKHDSGLWKIYPQLEQGAKERPQLLDEAFFAYREDADLAWRAQIKGKKIIYCPFALAHHVRRVTPEVRSKLPKAINYWSVRNRYLMQINNLKPLLMPKVLVNGFLIRNLLVFFGVLFKEQSSLRAFCDIIRLFPRALRQRKEILKNVTFAKYKNASRWFQNTN